MRVTYGFLDGEAYREFCRRIAEGSWSDRQLVQLALALGAQPLVGDPERHRGEYLAGVVTGVTLSVEPQWKEAARRLGRLIQVGLGLAAMAWEAASRTIRR